MNKLVLVIFLSVSICQIFASPDPEAKPSFFLIARLRAEAAERANVEARNAAERANVEARNAAERDAVEARNTADRNAAADKLTTKKPVDPAPVEPTPTDPTESSKK